MSNGRKREDAARQRSPICKCVGDHCQHPIYKRAFNLCRLFRSLIRNGKTPQNCIYYKH